MRAALLLLAACGGAATVPASEERPADGTILERAPCRIPDSYDALIAEIEPFITEELASSKLPATPVRELVPPAEYDRLVAAKDRCERVVYASSGLRVVGFVFRPPGEGPHPVVIWLRGGAGELAKITPAALRDLRAFADAGFVVVATQYRGNDGGEGRDEWGGADVDDVLALVPLARSLPGADVDRLYLVGGSRGAASGLVAIRRGLPVRAAAYRGGAFDLFAIIAARPGMDARFGDFIPDYATNREAALEARSAVRWVDEIRVPTLILHAREDWRSPLPMALDFAERLRAARVDVKLTVYPDDDHGLFVHRDAWIAEAIAWFREHGAFGGRQVESPAPP